MVFGVAGNTFNIIVYQAIRNEFSGRPQVPDLRAVKTVKAILRAHPHNTPGVLVKTSHLVVGKAVLLAYVVTKLIFNNGLCMQSINAAQQEKKPKYPFCGVQIVV